MPEGPDRSSRVTEVRGPRPAGAACQSGDVGSLATSSLLSGLAGGEDGRNRNKCQVDCEWSEELSGEYCSCTPETCRVATPTNQNALLRTNIPSACEKVPRRETYLSQCIAVRGAIGLF
jgi:hypothetical protein